MTKTAVIIILILFGALTFVIGASISSNDPVRQTIQTPPNKTVTDQVKAVYQMGYDDGFAAGYQWCAVEPRITNEDLQKINQ